MFFSDFEKLNLAIEGWLKLMNGFNKHLGALQNLDVLRLMM